MADTVTVTRSLPPVGGGAGVLLHAEERVGRIKVDGDIGPGAARRAARLDPERRPADALAVRPVDQVMLRESREIPLKLKKKRKKEEAHRQPTKRCEATFDQKRWPR